MASITSLLLRADDGSASAHEKLVERVYTELRLIANRRMERELGDMTLQPTALVHEAFLRLFGNSKHKTEWSSSRHFYGAAANAMRQVLIESARRRKSIKRGGEWKRVPADPDQFSGNETAEDILALDDALGRLQETKPEMANLVKLRFFTGMSIKDAAAQLNISSRTADDYWAYAKAWLRSDMKEHSSLFSAAQDARDRET